MICAPFKNKKLSKTENTKDFVSDNRELRATKTTLDEFVDNKITI